MACKKTMVRKDLEKVDVDMFEATPKKKEYNIKKAVL